VEDLLCVELKGQEGLLPIHDAPTFLYANAAEAQRHPYKFSLCEYFQRRTENPCKQSFFFIARRIIRTNVIAYVSMCLCGSVFDGRPTPTIINYLSYVIAQTQNSR
jgi:hypothetical protein